MTISGKRIFQTLEHERKVEQMARKNLNDYNPAGDLITGAADQGAQPVKEEQPEALPKKTGRPRTGNKRPYKYNISLEPDLWKYLHEISWTRRKPMVQIVNDLLRADMEAYIADCKERGVDPYEGWETD